MGVGGSIFWIVGGGFISFMGGWRVGRPLLWVGGCGSRYILGG